METSARKPPRLREHQGFLVPFSPVLHALGEKLRDEIQTDSVLKEKKPHYPSRLENQRFPLTFFDKNQRKEIAFFGIYSHFNTDRGSPFGLQIIFPNKARVDV